MEDTRELISSLRGLPSKCDCCEQEKAPEELDPVSGGEWICFECYDRMLKSFPPKPQAPVPQKVGAPEIFLGFSTKKDLSPQKIVDVMFQIAFHVKDNEDIRNLSREEFASWICDQCSKCGIEMSPCGASWGVLKCH